ncbi:MAG: tRNA epoxyqueuosine(34) reductase QueG [Ignavibacteriae bacterium]|nr:MAG: tRNA epoxyqueuosine(34) reductase QueG [Ignavibacteriota bacterium]
MKLTNELVIQKAKAIGFDLVGFAKTEELVVEVEKLEGWLKSGYHAGMEYMERNREKRKDVSKILSSAKSVISLAVNYFTDEHHSQDDSGGKVSRYAWGKDYHLILWAMLDEFEEELKECDPSFEFISYVDTGPVMDKAWAAKAGIGWMGKHSNIINRQFGSWIFIANIFTNSVFKYTEQIPDFCGSCTACIDACPTKAIVSDYVVDSNKCISYLTIENKGEIPEKLVGKFDGWLFGCDICQDVCPWNRKFSNPAQIKDFLRPQIKEMNLEEVLKMNQTEFTEGFNLSPVKRTKLKGLKRNAEFLQKNR